ncbi:hypothetical protein OAL67_01320 [bacterium]|nr:hypothetical protein [bacterium]
MNNSQQAQKGFRTFVLTLSVSLIVFSVVYFLVNQPTITSDSSDEVLGTTTVEEESVFGALSVQRKDVSSGSVLAGAAIAEEDLLGSTPVVPETPVVEESTESTVPDTGTVGITAGLISSCVVFGAGLFVIYKDPRRLALLGFERKVTSDL